jgi:hypothetical protein
VRPTFGYPNIKPEKNDQRLLLDNTHPIWEEYKIGLFKENSCNNLLVLIATSAFPW